MKLDPAVTKDLDAYIATAFDSLKAALRGFDASGLTGQPAPRTEPRAVADNPHKPGTPEHARWQVRNVIEKQVDRRSVAYQDAKAVADERLAALKRTDEPARFADGMTADELLEYVAKPVPKLTPSEKIERLMGAPILVDWQRPVLDAFMAEDLHHAARQAVTTRGPRGIISGATRFAINGRDLSSSITHITMT